MKKTGYRKRKPSKDFFQKGKFLLAIAVGVFTLYYLSFNDYGIVRHFQIKKELQQIQNQIDTLELQQRKLRETIIKLKTDSSYIEKLARERLKLVKKGEELYIVKKSPQGIEVEKSPQK